LITVTTFNDNDSYLYLFTNVSSTNNFITVETTPANYHIINPVVMPSIKLKQLQYESDSWKRSLGFMLDENVHFKIRLSEILQEEFNPDLLEECEKFQSKFIHEDNIIIQLEKEILKTDRMLVRERFDEVHILEIVNSSFIRLRMKINRIEKQFGKLKSAFIHFLSENIR
jgi:hypothetical protein